VLPYFGSEYESLTFMLYFNKKTNRLVKDYPAILGKWFNRLTMIQKKYFFDFFFMTDEEKTRIYKSHQIKSYVSLQDVIINKLGWDNGYFVPRSYAPHVLNVS
jgi:hypothetical protein